MIEQPTLGSKLLELRTRQGITQHELREKCHVSVRTIQRIEAGAVTPRASTVKILLEALGENPADWYSSSDVIVENQFSIKTLKQMLLINSTEQQLKNAITPAWIGGIVFFLFSIIEIAVESILMEEVSTSLITTLVAIKLVIIISFFLFTRGFLSLSVLFETQLLKIASYLSIGVITVIYCFDIIVLLSSKIEYLNSAFAVIPLGVISIIFGLGLLELQDGMGRIAKIAGRLEVAFGISYVTLIFSFVGLVLLAPLLIVEIVLLSKADQLIKEGQL
ncbi:helix-turn-helix transcriptional regulator [Ekhidna sp.]|uniref:helix-turn-helix domain-containing protein n=1 Tax=Ekhidna sp. TaxID=2608089 RepID=UPI003296CD67